MRLNKFIANNSKFSRRKADELIQSGMVFVNGKKEEKLGNDIDPKQDKVSIKTAHSKIQITIKVEEQKIYLALNKPAGYISTRSDEYNRKTVMALLPKIPNLRTVGRLDKDTEGLMFFTNDGEFINKLTHPRYECKKEYFLIIEGELSSQEKHKLEQGVIIDEKLTAPAKIQIKTISKGETTATITIHEGRKRQIRKMFAVLKHPVKYLQRIRIGQVRLGNLPKGEYRKLTSKEINAY